MIDRALGHYRVKSVLGAGGMGEVYRAQDTRLGRDVALKLLPPAFAADRNRRDRFRKEARALAALNHPNIVTVHSVEEVEGQHLLTMELIEGETLDRRIPGEGLALAKLLQWAVPLADGLAAAHEKGVVHRDFKPGNVMVTAEGRAVILDFGIAKFVGGSAEIDADEETLFQTSIGTLEGTMPYMSPEQVECLDVDARSDIFSLGVVLYEMGTGKRPFQGASAAALASSILKDEPPPIARYRSDLPAEFGELVMRCLEKSREQRPQSAREVKMALEALGKEASSDSSRPSAERSVAVLPFANRSTDKDDEYFSDGITEEIMNALAQISGLRVAARTSSFAYKDARGDLRSVANTLRVRYVLEGSVRRSGERLRITVQLVDVSTGYHLWSERYDRELTDVFEIQDEIAAAIAGKLEMTLIGSSEQRADKRATKNIEAFDIYLRGLAFQNRRGRSVYQAIRCFQRAIELDPGYADAHAMLADSQRLLATYGFESPATAMERARAAAEQALSLDASLAEAYATLADVACTYDFDDEAARRFWNQALEVQPDHTRARSERALWGQVIGIIDSEEAVSEARRAVETDPLNVWAISMLTLLLGICGNPEEGLQEAERGLKLDPDSYLAHFVMLQSRIWAHDWEDAIKIAGPALQMSGRHPWTLSLAGVAHAGAGDRPRGEAIYAELLARASGEFVQPFWISYLALALGKTDESMDWVKRAHDVKDPMRLFYSNWPGITKELMTQPGFAELVTKRAPK